MAKLDVTIIDGGISGITVDTLRHIVEAAHRNEPVILAINHEGNVSERDLRVEELEVIEHAMETLECENISFSVRSIAKRADGGFDAKSEVYNDGLLKELTSVHYEPDPRARRVAICGGIGPSFAKAAAFAVARQMEDAKPEKDYPFRGKQRKYIPPRRINARGLPKRSHR